MLSLAILLQAAGVVLTFTLGVFGYVIGPALVIAGGLLYRKENRRRKDALAGAPVQTVVTPSVPKRPFWQRAAIGFAGFACIAAIIVTLVFRMTAGMTDAANGFFTAAKAKDLPRAKSYLAEDFLASTSDTQLQSFFDSSLVSRYGSSSWNSRSIKNNRGEIEGNLTTDTGGVVPMKISFVKESVGWKIYSLRKPDAGLSSDGGRPSVPTLGEQQGMIRATTHAFADAIFNRNFSDFYLSVSGVWQRQTTPEKFASAVQGIVASGGNFRVLNDLQPTITVAQINNDGQLVLSGTYPVTPNPLSFEQKYIYEGLDWKLTGIEVHVDSTRRSL